MFYIQQTSCISPQKTFGAVDIESLNETNNKKLYAIEPSYEGIPTGVLRRMGKAVRMGVGAAMPILQKNSMPDGIIMATTNGGKDDCVKFLNQVMAYEEGILTPLNFVQSTPNALAAQISLLTGNKGYNITHLQQGLAFELAMIDADMMLQENMESSYLLGATDDISTHNYILEDKGGWYKKENISNKELYKSDSAGSIAGEGAAMFLVNGKAENALAKVLAVDTFQNEDENILKERLQHFIENNLPAGEKIDLLLSGENGDNRLLKYYSICECLFGEDVTIAHFKHICGDYPSAAAMGLWLCTEIVSTQSIPLHMIKKAGASKTYKNVLMYNNYKGLQHSMILISAI